jgi:hypothetical protein
MKSASTQLATHIAGETTTLATCWKVTRKDGFVFGFTDFDRDLTIDGLVYEARTGYTRSAVHAIADLSWTISTSKARSTAKRSRLPICVLVFGTMPKF